MSAGDGARPVAMDADHLGDPRHDPRPALIKSPKQAFPTRFQRGRRSAFKIKRYTFRALLIFLTSFNVSIPINRPIYAQDDIKYTCYSQNCSATETTQNNTTGYIVQIRGSAAPNGYFVSKQEDDVAGGAAFGSCLG